MSDCDVNKSTAIGAAIAVMSLVPLFFLVMPIYVGALATDYGYDGSTIGHLLSIELAGAALASLVALAWLRVVNWRRSLYVFLGLLVVSNLFSLIAKGDFAMLQYIRPIAGFAAGSAMAIAIAAMGDSEKQDRNFAFGVVGQLTVSGLLLLVLPIFTSRWGVAAVYSLFMVAGVVVMSAVRWHAAIGTTHTGAAPGTSRSLLPLWGLAGGAAIFVAQSAVWAFIERIGADAGLAGGMIGLALGLSVLAGIGGALAASWLADSRGRLLPMVIGLIGEVLCLGFLFGEISVVVFFGAVIGYNVFWNFWLPYQMATVAECDVSGRFIALITFSQAVGIAAGPALVGPLIVRHGYDPVVWAGIGFAILALMLFLPIIGSRRPVVEARVGGFNS